MCTVSTDQLKHNRDILFIIGNGFDLHHNISSSYADFHDWLLSNDYSHFVKQLEFIFHRSADIDLWSDFESALGNYDCDSLYHEYADDIEIDYDHMMRTTAQKEDATISAIGGILEDIRPIFAKWIASIDIKNIKPKLTLPQEAKYITFNYTKTLEEVYRIPTNNILHIHGGTDGYEDIVVGHDNIVDPNSVYSEKETEFYEENGKKQIIEAMNELFKDVEEVMNRHINIFKSLSNIRHVVTYGHSLSDIDKPYFKLIKGSICPDTEWFFYKHSKKDCDRIKAMINDIGIRKWHTFSF